MRDEYKIFAQNLKYYMKKFGYTQLSLADKLDVRNTAVCTWMSGDRFPRMKTLDDLCKVFDCTRADLIQIEQKDRTDEEKARLERLFIYAQRLNDKGILRVIDFIDGLKDEYFED